MPRPLSRTEIEPSTWMFTSIRWQGLARGLSTELSSPSHHTIMQRPLAREGAISETYDAAQLGKIE